MISDYKNKVIITRYGAPTQTAGGGLVRGNALISFSKHYNIESRSGSMNQQDSQRDWSYDFKLTGRYYKTFVERGGDIITYGDKTLIVKTVSFDDEGAMREVILRCSVNE